MFIEVLSVTSRDQQLSWNGTQGEMKFSLSLAFSNAAIKAVKKIIQTPFWLKLKVSFLIWCREKKSDSKCLCKTKAHTGRKISVEAMNRCKIWHNEKRKCCFSPTRSCLYCVNEILCLVPKTSLFSALRVARMSCIF